jgi:hypothetical protein
MVDLFPPVYATLKANSYFTDDWEGFLDNGGRFKVYKRNEAPSADSPYITVEIQPGGQDQRNGWVTPFVTFHVWGKDTEWEDLYAIAEEVRDIFESANAFEPVGSDEAIDYQTIGQAEFDEGEDPVTRQVVVSVALRFGFSAV